jgi:hypothetical protein
MFSSKAMPDPAFESGRADKRRALSLNSRRRAARRGRYLSLAITKGAH